MTNATQTSLGEVKLAGDLAGSNNALAPELTPTGVSAGSYILPSVTFDTKGRATYVANGSASTIQTIIPTATSTTRGIASFPESGGLIINAGQVSVPTASGAQKGIAKFGTEFTVANGVASINSANLPKASANSFGAVKTGLNIVNSAGTISVPNASTSVKGIASFNATQFNVTDGSVTFNTSSLPIASSTLFGIIKTGAGVINDAGVISVPVATAGTAGIVQIGENIVNTAGNISVATATNSVKGVASFSTDFTVTNGSVEISANVAKVDVQNTWAKAQAYSVVTLPYAATITPDFSRSNVFSMTASGNFTLANPINVVPGATYILFITQDESGYRTINWGSNFKFSVGAVTRLSSGPGKTDVISIVAQSGSKLLVSTQTGF